MSTDPREFQAGPSFLDYDRPDVRMVELPAWLQTFAATVGDPGDDWTEQQASGFFEPNDVTEAAVDDMELSPWLRESDNDAPATSPTTNGSAIDPSFMISEEDLPDWLRSIPPAEAGDVAGGSAPVVDGGISVPTISRAWLPAVDQPAPAVDENASVFSLVASQGPPAAYPGVVENQVADDQFHALEQARPMLASSPAGGATALDSAENPDAAEDGTATSTASRLLTVVLGVALVVLIVLVAMTLL